MKVSGMPLFKGQVELWKRYKDADVSYLDVLEEFGLSIALHAATADQDARLLAIDYAERVTGIARNEEATILWQVASRFADGLATPQRLGIARKMMIRTLEKDDSLKDAPAIRAAKASILAAARTPTVYLAEAAEKAARAMQHETKKLSAGERAYLEERNHQKEMFKAFFS
jgi:hypothetical protein